MMPDTGLVYYQHNFGPATEPYGTQNIALAHPIA